MPGLWECVARRAIRRHQSWGLLTPTSFYCKKENNMNQAKEMARIAYEALSEKREKISR